MGETGIDYVLEFGGLRSDRRGDVRVCMAEEVGPPARDGIKVTPAVKAFEPGAAATSHRQQRQFVAVFPHLGAWVPNDGEVAGKEGGNIAL